MDYEAFGQRVQALRARRGISQGQLAKETGISQSRLSGIMNGKGGSVGIDIVEKLCIALKTTPSYLMGFSLPKDDLLKQDAELSARSGVPLELVEAFGFDSVPYFREFLTAGVIREAEWFLSHIANNASKLCMYRDGEAFKKYMMAAGIPVEDYEKEFDTSTKGAMYDLEELFRVRTKEFAQAYLTHKGEQSDKLMNKGGKNGDNPQENK